MSLIMLTKQGCTNCNSMKNFLKTKRMKGYAEHISETILDVKEPERYNELRTAASDAKALPILINTEDGTVFDSGFNSERLYQKFVNKYGKLEGNVSVDTFANL